MKKFIFIINPISGSGKRSEVINRIHDTCKELGLEYQVEITQYAGHATEIAEQYRGKKKTVVCAVGGDGSLNEVAKGIVGGVTPMGIIPVGSGNGLARHLRIPLNFNDALSAVLNGRTKKIDTGYFNGELFIVTSGIGFDAEVTHNFSLRSTRGLLGYVKESLKLFPSYQAKNYKITANGITKHREAFTISVANASQYGNDAVIAKDASVSDGYLDLCVIKKYPKMFGPQIGISLFMKNLHNSKFYRGQQAQAIYIESEGDETTVHAQLDGEAHETEFPIYIEVVPKNLKVIIPQDNL